MVSVDMEYRGAVPWEDMKDSIHLAYLAGFFDGDGSIVATIEPNKECRFGYRTRVIVKCAQHKSHREICDEMRSTFICGSVSKSQKDVVEFSAKRAEDVKRILVQLLPYLRLKQKQAKLALELLALYGKKNENTFRQAVQLVKQVQALNYSGRSRRSAYPRND